MEEKKSNFKVLWIILFTVIAVILCYLFTVVYFYFISPYNISIKLGFWPFSSDVAVGDMYSEATVEINFKVQNENFVEEEKKVVGVNIRQDGFVVAPYSEFRDCKEDTIIKVLTTSGRIYSGKLLFVDKDYNLAILKCESVASEGGEIKIPYVNINETFLSSREDERVISVSTPVSDKKIWIGTIYGANYTLGVSKTVDGTSVVDFVQEDGFVIDLDMDATAYTGGAVFDRQANLLGFSYDLTMTEELEYGYYFVMPVEGARFFIDEVVNNYYDDKLYTNLVKEELLGFDQIELDYFLKKSEISSVHKDKFYFNDAWHSYNEDITYFSTSEMSGYYLFEDFTYNSQTVKSGSVITAIDYENESYDITEKSELFNVIYQIKPGEKFRIFYKEIQNGESSTLKSITITF